MNQADTAWMLISTALVLLMTPALAFFYGGLVRAKNALNTMMMSFISLGFVGALWAEMYGTVHLGSIRALASSALVAASAIGPGIAGYLIDAGIDLDQQGFIYAAYCLGGIVLFNLLRKAFARRVAETAVPVTL